MVPSSATPSTMTRLPGSSTPCPCSELTRMVSHPRSRRERTAWDQTDLVPIGEYDVRIGMDFAVLQPRHPVIHASRQFADFRMERAAESHVHLLQAAADAKQRYAPGDANFRQGQRQFVTMNIVRFVPQIRLGTEALRMNIGSCACQHHAIHHVQQCTDISDVGRARKHQWQCASHIGHRAQISLSDQLRVIIDFRCDRRSRSHRPPASSSS